MLLEYNSLQGSLWSASDPIYAFSTDPSSFHNPLWTLYPVIYGNLLSLYFIPMLQHMLKFSKKSHISKVSSEHNNIYS